jgi:hypothetical protein
MELHKFHVHQRRTGMVGERMAVARILPTVAGDLVSPSIPPSPAPRPWRGRRGIGRARDHTQTPRDATAILQQRDYRVFHEHVEPQMDSMVLKVRIISGRCGRPHAQAEDTDGRRNFAAEFDRRWCDQKRAPASSSRTRRSFFGMLLRHPPVIRILTATHGVCKVNTPAVSVVHFPLLRLPPPSA